MTRHGPRLKSLLCIYETSVFRNMRLSAFSAVAAGRRRGSAVLDHKITSQQAAKLPIAGVTALRALRVGGAILGCQVRITGATGGVGQFAVQLAALSGARVTAFVSSDKRTGQPQRLPGSAVLSSYPAAATTRRWWSLTSTRISSASRRTKQALRAFTIYFEGRIPIP